MILKVQTEPSFEKASNGKIFKVLQPDGEPMVLKVLGNDVKYQTEEVVEGGRVITITSFFWRNGFPFSIC